MRTVVWQPRAVKQLKKLGDRTVQVRILQATDSLAHFRT